MDSTTAIQNSNFQELNDKLAKIRLQIHSKLDNQKHIAIILTSIEENIVKDNTTNLEITNHTTLINYLVSILQLFDKSINFNIETNAKIIDPNLANSTIYLLDIILNYLPKKLIKSKFSGILTKIVPCIIDQNSSPLLIRSTIGCLESLIKSQDINDWNNVHNLNISTKMVMQGVLELSNDERPKIRKRALDAIKSILLSLPKKSTTKTSKDHIGTIFVTDFNLSNLSTLVKKLDKLENKKVNINNKSEIESQLEETIASVIRNLKLTNTIILTNNLPSKFIESICNILLSIIKSSNQYLISNSFNCFENLFNSMLTDNNNNNNSNDSNNYISTINEDKFLKIFNTIISLNPSMNDTNLVAAWIAVIVKGFNTYSSIKPLNSFEMLPDLMILITNYLKSNNSDITTSASECLIAIINQSIDDKILLTKDQDIDMVNNVNNTLDRISNILVDLLSINYIGSINNILKIISIAFIKFRHRSYPSFIKPLQIIDTWRTNADTDSTYVNYQTEIDNVIGSAITGMGPEIILNVLPLNLIDNDKNSTDKTGRAWLLPLLRDYTKHSKLNIFINDLLPIISHFEEQFTNLPKESMQLTILKTIVDQIWSILPRFMDLPLDLIESFTDEFAQHLCSLLYSNVELRTTICHSLRLLVESNLTYSKQNPENVDILLREQISIDQSLENLKYLTSKSTNLLPVFFNVYTQTAVDSRGYILDTIESYLKITSESDIEQNFNNVCTLLKDSIDQDNNNANNKKENGKPQLTSTLLDIIITMVQYLPATSYDSLFAIFNTTINSTNNLIQKRSYRIIVKLSELPIASDIIVNHLNFVEDIIISNSHTVHAASRSTRLLAIKTIVTLLSSNKLDFIVKCVAEVILATKDVNEKTRNIAFDTLITMGNKMDKEKENGIIQISDTDSTHANISEFFKIVSVGLIGESQHMVSATITAYSCLIFEFKDILPNDIILEIYDTIELYLTSNSREIVKSAIGFAKVCVLSLPIELMKPKIPDLLIKLLRWSNEHTGHFKQRVKHIIERLIRRFSYEFIEEHFPEEDKKLLANIRKTNNRNKRNKDNGTADNVTSVTKGPKFMSAFDEVIYDSSDDENDEDDNRNDKEYSKKNTEQYIMEKSGDNPLDLLDSKTLAHISSTRPKKYNGKSKKNKNAESFSFDDEGKLIVNGKEKSINDDDEDPLRSITSGINAYLDAVKQGPVRGQRNKLKFKKNARSGEGEDFSDDDSKVSKPNNSRNKIGKKRNNPKFKSKRKL